MLSISLLAWKCSGFIKENVPETLLGIYLICTVTNSTVLLPASSLIIVLEYARVINPFLVVFFGALGATTGELIGFFVGRAGSRVISKKWFGRVKQKFEEHPYRWVLLFALIPVPIFDMAGIIAGSAKLNVFKFYSSCFCGKVIKMGSYVFVFGLLENIMIGLA